MEPDGGRAGEGVAGLGEADCCCRDLFLFCTSNLSGLFLPHLLQLSQLLSFMFEI